jgi:Transmembrane secretion effector
VVGPAIAAVLVSTIGIGWCFVANAVSFGFVIASLLSLDKAGLHQITPVPRGRGQLRAGLRYAAGVGDIIRPLLMMALVGSTPIGSPVIGAIAAVASSRYALALGAAACLAAVVVGRWPAHRAAGSPPAVPATLPV